MNQHFVARQTWSQELDWKHPGREPKTIKILVWFDSFYIHVSTITAK